MDGRYLGIDLGGTNIRLALVNKEGEVGDLTYISAKEYSTWDGLLTELTSIIKGIKADRIKAVGIAVAGGVLISKEIMSYSPHIKWLNGVPIKESLATAINLPVWMDNDANAIIYGEWMYGAGRGFSSMICLTLGSGVGGGIIINRNLYRGEDGLGGEIGHMCVQPDGRACRCGKRGCLEAYSYGSALSKIYRECKQNRELNYQLNPVQIYEKAIAGEKLARDVFDIFGEHLGIVIASLVNVFSIHHYIITVGVSRAWELFFDSLENAMEANLFMGISA